MQPHYAVRELPAGEQLQRHRAMPRVDQGNAFPDQGGNNVNDEFIDLSSIEKRRDEWVATLNVVLSVGFSPVAKPTVNSSKS